MKRLTEEDKKLILRCNDTNNLAKRLNCAPSTVWRIRKRLQCKNRERRGVTEEMVKEIRSLWKTGNFSLTDLRKKFGVYVESIIYGKGWKNINTEELPPAPPPIPKFTGNSE